MYVCVCMYVYMCVCKYVCMYVCVYVRTYVSMYVCTYVRTYVYDCSILQDERDRLIGKISRHDNWPVNKRLLGNKYIKQFIHFTNTIDFTKL